MYKTLLLGYERSGMKIFRKSRKVKIYKYAGVKDIWLLIYSLFQSGLADSFLLLKDLPKYKSRSVYL